MASDFSFDDYSDPAVSSYDYSSWSTPAYEPSTWDTSSFANYPSSVDYSGDVGPQPFLPPSWMNDPQAQGNPPWASPGQRQGQVPGSPWLGALGAAPGLMQLLSQLTGGGRTTTTSSRLPTNQQAMQNQAQQQQLARGQTQLGAMQGMAPGSQQLFQGGSGLLQQLMAGMNPMQQQQMQQLLGMGQAAQGGQSLMAQLMQGQSPMQQQQQSYLSQLTDPKSMASQLMQGTSPLQQQQAKLLSQLQIPQAGGMQMPDQAYLSDLVQKAYGPMVGNIGKQAIEQARNQGFSGGAELLNTGVGGALAGPALAQASGMEAQSLLKAMIDFPRAYSDINYQNAQIADIGNRAVSQYNQPISQLMQMQNYGPQVAGSFNAPVNSLMQALGFQNQFAQAFNNPLQQFGNYAGQGMGPLQNLAGNNQGFNWPQGSTTTTQNNDPWGQYLGQAFGGALQGYQLPQQQAQSSQFAQMMRDFFNNGGFKESAGGMSGNA